MSHLLKTAKSKDFWLAGHPKGMINIHPTFIEEKLNAQLNREGIGSGTQRMGDLHLTVKSHRTKLE